MTTALVGEQIHDHSEKCASPRTFFFECPDCHRPHRVIMGCGKRFTYFCPDCAKRWQRKTRNRFYQGSMGMISPKFMTLTLRKTGRVQERLLTIWEMRRRLFQQLKRWGYRIRSWCGVVEPPNHVHLIIDCDFIPGQILSEAWQTITGDSFIVDIRKINATENPRQVFSYVTKYMTKASEWDGCNLDLLKGFHLVNSHGLIQKKRPRVPICVCESPNPLIRLAPVDYFSMVNSDDYMEWMFRKHWDDLVDLERMRYRYRVENDASFNHNMNKTAKH